MHIYARMCVCMYIYIYVFIYIGIQVDYATKVANLEPGPAVIRCLLLCWTGDHPAQCEIGKFLGAGGSHACRRDKVTGNILIK